jgi:SAM-dependent methyltransferase
METPQHSGLYPPAVAALWRRIELERPATYWEENVVEGRRALRRRLLAWMEEVEGLRILDAGCGFGAMARLLTERGARVHGCDLRRDAIAHAAANVDGSGQTFAVEDLRIPLAERGRFDAVLLLEVLEELGSNPVDVLALLGGCGAPALYLSLRIEGAWSRLLEPILPRGLEAAVDPVATLRTLHLETPYRLVRQATIRRRNFGAQLMELRLP